MAITKKKDKPLPKCIEVCDGLNGLVVEPRYVDVVKEFLGCKVYVTKFCTKVDGEWVGHFFAVTARLKNGDVVSGVPSIVEDYWNGESRVCLWYKFTYHRVDLELKVLLPERGRCTRCHFRWGGYKRGEGVFIKLWLKSADVKFQQGVGHRT